MDRVAVAFTRIAMKHRPDSTFGSRQ